MVTLAEQLTGQLAQQSFPIGRTPQFTPISPIQQTAIPGTQALTGIAQQRAIEQALGERRAQQRAPQAALPAAVTGQAPVQAGAAPGAVPTGGGFGASLGGILESIGATTEGPTGTSGAGDLISSALRTFAAGRAAQREREERDSSKEILSGAKTSEELEAAILSGGLTNNDASRAQAVLNRRDKLAERGITSTKELEKEARAEKRQVNKEDRAAVRLTEKDVKAAQVSGFDFQEGIVPKAADATRVKEANVVANQINTALDRIDTQMKEVGTEAFDIFGTESEDLNRERQKIIVLQNKLAGLGALAGEDLNILEAIVPDPTAFFTRGSVVEDQLKSFRETVAGDVNSIARASGFTRSGETTQAKTQKEPIQTTVRKFNSKTGALE